MKKVSWMVVSLLLFATTVAKAQDSDSGGHRTNAQIVEFILNVQEKSVLAAAEAMPAEKYGFAPTRGEFKGVRTFAQQLVHIASDNYSLGAGILGEKPPVNVGDGENGDTSLRTKAEILPYLKQSFAYMHRAAAAIDDGNAPIPTPAISPWPAGTATRLGVAIEDEVHTYDHYGQVVEYLRMNGIAPPHEPPTAAEATTANSAKVPGADPAEQRSVGQELDMWTTKTEELLVPAAEAMPEERYSFAPTNGEFRGVRTFAEQVKHLAASNYIGAAAALGEKPPNGEANEVAPTFLRTKSEIMDYLRGSFANLHRAAAAINPQNEAEIVGAKPRGTRPGFIIDVLLHAQDHYGQMIEYLRMNGIVPPASR